MRATRVFTSYTAPHGYFARDKDTHAGDKECHSTEVGVIEYSKCLMAQNDHGR